MRNGEAGALTSVHQTGNLLNSELFGHRGCRHVLARAADDLFHSLGVKGSGFRDQD